MMQRIVPKYSLSLRTLTHRRMLKYATSGSYPLLALPGLLSSLHVASEPPSAVGVVLPEPHPAQDPLGQLLSSVAPDFLSTYFLGVKQNETKQIWTVLRPCHWASSYRLQNSDTAHTGHLIQSSPPPHSHSPTSHSQTFSPLHSLQTNAHTHPHTPHVYSAPYSLCRFMHLLTHPSHALNLQHILMKTDPFRLAHPTMPQHNSFNTLSLLDSHPQSLIDTDSQTDPHRYTNSPTLTHTQRPSDTKTQTHRPSHRLTDANSKIFTDSHTQAHRPS